MRFTVLNLGRKGISIAKTPMAIADGALLSAQNAELDFDATDGAIAKRKGLREITPTALEGDVLALFSGGLFFSPEPDPIGGGESEFGPAALNVMRAKAYLSAATTAVANNTETAIDWTAEAFDVGNLHDLVTNPSRFTVPTGGDGVYAILAQAKWASDADGIRSVRVYVNGALVAQDDCAAGTTDFVYNQAKAYHPLVAGDYVEVKVLHTGGAALNLEGSAENETFALLLRLISATTSTLPRCQGLMTSNLSCVSGVATVVPLQGETFDTHTMHDLVTNNSRITVPAQQGGLYAIVGHFAWAATMIGAFQVELRKNGTTTVGERRDAGENLAATDSTGQVVAVETLEPADYIEMVVTQATGGAFNLLGGAALDLTKLTLARIG